mmetsp:Transcript_32405/g.70853  ORF Transcript_32405/g.70853 Transcript_32405/m.70853 type:complete len:227 (-) Transcript_32405:526-1206(-)
MLQRRWLHLLLLSFLLHGLLHNCWLLCGCCFLRRFLRLSLCLSFLLLFLIVLIFLLRLRLRLLCNVHLDVLVVLLVICLHLVLRRPWGRLNSLRGLAGIAALALALPSEGLGLSLLFQRGFRLSRLALLGILLLELIDPGLVDGSLLWLHDRCRCRCRRCCFRSAALLQFPQCSALHWHRRCRHCRLLKGRIRSPLCVGTDQFHQLTRDEHGRLLRRCSLAAYGDL